jgi:hypothetical protein
MAFMAGGVKMPCRSGLVTPVSMHTHIACFGAIYGGSLGRKTHSPQREGHFWVGSG